VSPVSMREMHFSLSEGRIGAKARRADDATVNPFG
jgi:hypothetical protein